MNCFANDSVKHLTTLKYTNQDRKWLPQKWICHYRHKWDSKHLSILWMDKNYIVFKHANYCWIEMALMWRTFISCPLFLAKTISCMQNLLIFNIISNRKSPIKWSSLEQSRSCSPVSLKPLVIPPNRETAIHLISLSCRQNYWCSDYIFHFSFCLFSWSLWDKEREI